MEEFIHIPRDWLTPKVLADPDYSRAVLYLAKEIADKGVAGITPIEAANHFGLSPKRYRTLLGLLAKDTHTDMQGACKGTRIAFKQQSIKPTKGRAKGHAKGVLKDTQLQSLPQSDCDYVDPRFAEIWSTFLKYRKEINKPYKSPQSEIIAYNKMLELANHDPIIAKDMVERTILGQWQGLFPNQNGKQTSNNKTTADARAEERATMADQLQSVLVKLGNATCQSGN